MRYYGVRPPSPFGNIVIGGQCPHCREGGRWSVSAPPNWGVINAYRLTEFTTGYYCELCLKPIAVNWKVRDSERNKEMVYEPRMIIRMLPPFELDHVPENVQNEIQEALNCYSAGAMNGFAAVCRRAVQAICTEIGAKANAKVKAQIKEASELANLDEATTSLAFEVMLAGHDGSHPHLPEVTRDRGEVLLQLLQDLTHQLFTRPGKIAESARLRRTSIAREANRESLQ